MKTWLAGNFTLTTGVKTTVVSRGCTIASRRRRQAVPAVELVFKVAQTVPDTTVVAAAKTLQDAVASGAFRVELSDDVIVSKDTVPESVTVTGDVATPSPPPSTTDSDQWHMGAVLWLALLGVMLVIGAACTMTRRRKRGGSEMGQASVAGFM